MVWVLLRDGLAVDAASMFTNCLLLAFPGFELATVVNAGNESLVSSSIDPASVLDIVRQVFFVMNNIKSLSLI